MLIDLSTLDKNTSLKQYDVCICGTGPSGITVARTLASQGLTVALLEGGGLEYSENSQELYKGKNVGLNNWDAIRNCRLRFFGGTSNHWEGRCSYFDPVDFEQRGYVDLPGWPISRKEIFSHFEEACSILDLPKDAFSRKTKWPGTNFRISDKELSPPTRFGTKYREELKKSSKIDVYINANLTDVRLNDSLNKVKSFEVKSYSGIAFNFIAKNYVFAMGAIENARLLLNSDKQVKGGIGNKYDMVGRCFMEHFNVEFGRFVVEDKSKFIQGSLEVNPSEAFMRSHRIGNAVLSFNPSFSTSEYGHFQGLKKSVREFFCKYPSLTDLSRKVKEFDCSGDGVIRSLIEQVPNLQSRIMLDTETDMFGMRKVKLDWKASEADNHTIRTLGIEVAKEMARTNVARVQLQDFILDKNIEIPDYGHHCHQLGTTRMSADPKFGVVDKDSRVHGLENLFIAGSSVYSTGAGCNPTLTLVMLSLRLGEHLAKKVT